MTENVALKTRGSHPTRGLIAQIFAIVGIVACIVLIVGLWLGRSWVYDGITGLTGSIDAALDRAAAAAGQAGTRVDEVATEMGDTADTAQAVADDPAVARDQLQPVAARVTGVVDRYRGFRAAYAGLHETVVGAVDTMQRIDRFVPWISVPEGPINALAAVDQRISGLDQAVTDLAGVGDGVGAVQGTATKMAEASRRAETALTGVSGGFTNLQSEISNAQADLARLTDILGTVLLIASVILTLLLLYIIVLHVVLWSAGSRWQHGPA